MSHYTLDTSAHSVMAAIVLQGFGFAALFVPLTTVALASIPRYRLTDATGLNSLLRQIGGSLGLAAFATLLPHFEQTARVGLIAHLVPGRPEVTAAGRRRSSRAWSHAASTRARLRRPPGA